MFRRCLVVPPLAACVSAIAQAADDVFADPSGASKPLAAGFEYVSGAGCPDEAQFRRQVAGHLRAPSPASPLPVRVEVQALDGRASARVTFGSKSGASAVREVSGASCEEAAAAAALVVALAIDAETEQPKPDTAPAKPSEPPRVTPAVATPALDGGRTPTRGTEGVFLQFGAGALAEHAIAPSPLFGVRAFFGLGESRPSWDLRAVFVLASSGDVESDAESAEFSLLAGQIEGCTFPITRTERFVLDTCLTIELGRVESEGHDSLGYAGSKRSSFWAAAGPGLRARYSFSELSVEALAGPWVPFGGTRTFVFEDPQGNRTFHEVPPVGWFAGAGLALRVR